jgi:hypothetical protein
MRPMTNRRYAHRVRCGAGALQHDRLSRSRVMPGNMTVPTFIHASAWVVGVGVLATLGGGAPAWVTRRVRWGAVPTQSGCKAITPASTGIDPSQTLGGPPPAQCRTIGQTSLDAGDRH